MNYNYFNGVLCTYLCLLGDGCSALSMLKSNVAKNNDLSEAADSSAFMSAIGYFYKLTV